MSAYLEHDISMIDFAPAPTGYAGPPRPLMLCGHAAASALDGDDRRPVCPIDGCTEVHPVQPDLTGRRARCDFYGRTARRGVCWSEAPSDLRMHSFTYLPDAEYDRYYCGCWGWE